MFGLARSAFWQWWISELASLSPAKDQRILANQRSTAEINVGVQEVRSYHGQTLLEPLSAGKCKEASSTLANFSSSRRPNSKAVLSFDEELCLVRQVILPKAALPRASDILDLELSSITPFARNDVVSGWFPSGDAVGQQQKVTHVVLKKQDFDTAVGALKKAGMSVVAVAIRSANTAAMPVVFEADGELLGARENRRSWKLAIAAGLACILSSIGAASVSLWKQQRSIAEYEVAISELQNSALEVRKAIDGLAVNSNRAQALIKLRYTKAGLLALWAELTHLIPDQAWVQNLSLSGNNLRIDGVAKDAETLIGRLEASPNLKKVRFAAPVFRDAGVSGSRFSIALDVEKPLP